MFLFRIFLIFKESVVFAGEEYVRDVDVFPREGDFRG